MSKLAFLFSVAFLIQMFSVSAQNFSFDFNLKQGDTNQAVYEMQKLLNKDLATRVASVGPGSLGNETSFFGLLTKEAVVRFQEKYSKDILATFNLSRGTGFVGPSTRLKLNQIVSASAQKVVSPKISAPQSSVPSISKLPLVYISGVSVYSGLPGTKILIVGGGFTAENNSISFGVESTIEKLPSKGGSSILVTVPNIPSGVYDLKVTNINGVFSGDAFFIVTEPGSSAPLIVSVTPERVSYGAEITIKGVGFTSDNQIRTSYEIIKKVVSSDGTTLRFTVKPYPDTMGAAANLKNATDIKKEWKMHFYVVNKNGMTPNPGQFILEL